MSAETVNFTGVDKIDQGSIWNFTFRLKDNTQIITKGAGVSSGTWAASWGVSGFVNETALINFDAVGATVQTAFEGLPSVGPGNVTGTGAAGGPWSVLFSPDLIAQSNNPLIQISKNNLVGGSIAVSRKAWDLTGYTAKMDIRPAAGSGTLYQTLSTANAKITLGWIDGSSPDPTNGVVHLSLTDTDTGALSFTTAVYDLELTNTLGTVIRIAQGSVELSPQVTA